MPNAIQVFHRCDLEKTFYNDIKNKQNILILIDEVHVASMVGMTITNIFKQVGLFDKSYLYDNDIKLVEFSAAPEGTIYDLLKWNNKSSALILSEAGIGYTGAYNLLLQNRVKQYKDLFSNESAFDELKHDINNYVNTPRSHIRRTKHVNYIMR